MTEKGRSGDILYSVNNMNYIFLGVFLYLLINGAKSFYLLNHTENYKFEVNFFINYVYNWETTWN